MLEGGREASPPHELAWRLQDLIRHLAHWVQNKHPPALQSPLVLRPCLTA